MSYPLTSEPILGRVSLRGTSTSLSLRCDAAAADAGGRDTHVLLLSAAGAETAVKALTAVLRSETRVEVNFDVPGLHCYKPQRYPGGYRVQRARLDGDTWHVLCVAKVDGFLPVLSEEALWRELRSERFTTPLLRGWVPWLVARLRETGALVELRQAGCNAGLLRLDTDGLDRLVSEGIQAGALRVED
jgi:hypothetical protein